MQTRKRPPLAIHRLFFVTGLVVIGVTFLLRTPGPAQRRGATKTPMQLGSLLGPPKAAERN